MAASGSFDRTLRRSNLHSVYPAALAQEALGASRGLAASSAPRWF